MTVTTDRAGDFEDYALLKMRTLIDKGVAPDRLRLAQLMKSGDGS